jgi:hypothetical protein
MAHLLVVGGKRMESGIDMKRSRRVDMVWASRCVERNESLKQVDAGDRGDCESEYLGRFE